MKGKSQRGSSTTWRGATQWEWHSMKNRRRVGVSSVIRLTHVARSRTYSLLVAGPGSSVVSIAPSGATAGITRAHIFTRK